jgi:hypothetical protein
MKVCDNIIIALDLFLNQLNRVPSSCTALKMGSGYSLPVDNASYAADVNNRQHRCKNVEFPMFILVYSNNEPCVNAYKQLKDKLAVTSGIVDWHKACSCRWIALDRFTMICRKHLVISRNWCPLFGWDSLHTNWGGGLNIEF